MDNVRGRRTAAFALLSLGLVCAATSVDAQTLVANDDSYGVPFGEPLLVEAYGVLDNDTLDGEAAGSNGVTADLVSDVSHGTLVLNPDGSFSYTPDSSFAGSDAFSYRAVFDPVSQPATVALTACTGGPQVFSCWQEAAFLAKSLELGLGDLSFQEGFEDDAAWGTARLPDTAPSISSMGIRWQTNHPHPPAGNEITTSGGPASTGAYGVFDSAHGYATGTFEQCNVGAPPPECLYHDGFRGTSEPGEGALHGVGGFISGTTGAHTTVVLDGTQQIGFSPLPDPGHHFFGVIDGRAQGFTRFEFREVDGKVGQELRIFGDDFTLLREAPTLVPALSAPGLVGLVLLLAIGAVWYQRTPWRPAPEVSLHSGGHKSKTS